MEDEIQANDLIADLKEIIWVCFTKKFTRDIDKINEL
jgi:hypothetical protein